MYLFIYLFILREREGGKERERERESTGGAEREEEKESQAGTDRAQPNVGLDPRNQEIMTWAKIKSQTLNQLIHPGAPWPIYFYHWTVFHCMNVPQSVYPFAIDKHLGCIRFWVMTNKAVKNICMQILCVCGHKALTHLRKYLGAWLLDCIVIIYLAL